MAANSTIGKNKIVTLRSQDRSWGTPSNFGLNLAQFNLNPKYVSYHQVAIPNGFYNVNSNSCNLQATVTDNNGTAWPIQASITPGNYNSTNLIPLVQTQLNSALVAVNSSANTAFFTVSYNLLTGYVTLTSTPNATGWSFSINTQLQSLDWILGFRPSQSITTVTSAVGAASLDLRSYPVIHIRSSIVAGNYQSSRGSDSVLCTVQNTALFGQTIFQRSPTADLDVFPVSGQIGQLTIQLVDEWGTELTMNTNQDWEISIGLYD